MDVVVVGVWGCVGVGGREGGAVRTLPDRAGSFLLQDCSGQFSRQEIEMTPLLK